jgi:MFS family permease
MPSRKSFLGALWVGDIVGAIGALVAGVLHMIVMGLFLLVLTAISPLLAVILPFVAYQLDSESLGMFAFFYFVLGGFVSATFTGIVYVHVTREERRERGEPWGQYCRNIGIWPILSIICSWITSAAYTLTFKDSLLWSDTNTAHAIFFAMAPVAVFSPLWVCLIHRRRQKTAMEALSRKFAERRGQKDGEFLCEQGIVS